MIYGDKYLSDEPLNFIILDESNMSGEDTFDLKLGSNDCFIWVYAGEGNYPHFHLITKKIKTCIMLKYSEYFHHKGYRDTLKSNYCKELNEWLGIEIDRKSNWQRLVDKWNYNNPNPVQQIPEGYQKPDYSIIYPKGTFTKVR